MCQRKFERDEATNRSKRSCSRTVNCETHNTSSCRCLTEWRHDVVSLLHSLHAKSFLQQKSRSCWVSSSWRPTSARAPGPMDETTCPSTETVADFTLCTTSRMARADSKLPGSQKQTRAKTMVVGQSRLFRGRRTWRPVAQTMV
mgnify:CR=1 FL=1